MTNELIITITENTEDFKGLLWTYEDAFDWEDFQMPEESYLGKVIRRGALYHFDCKAK